MKDESRENAINFMEKTIEVLCTSFVAAVEAELEKKHIEKNDMIAALVVINSNMAARSLCAIADTLGLNPEHEDANRIMRAIPNMVRELFAKKPANESDDIEKLLKTLKGRGGNIENN